MITTSMADPEWPDNLAPETGVFTYYGDNKQPGRELHDTPRYGNLLLRTIYEALHTGHGTGYLRYLIFASTGRYRDMAFKGLLFLAPSDSLHWKTWLRCGSSLLENGSRIIRQNSRCWRSRDSRGVGWPRCEQMVTGEKRRRNCGFNGWKRGSTVP